MQFDYKKYFERLGITSTLEPNLANLKLLHKHHLMTIPFENLDIHLHRIISLDLSDLFHKIIDNHRGGFCYELNGLFNELLTYIGYSTKIISARVKSDQGGFGQEFDHMAIVVKLHEQEHLVDVGFGAFITEPLTFIPNQNQNDNGNTFMISKFNDNYFVVAKLNEHNIFEPLYIFSTVERQMDEFTNMCVYHQTSEKSSFTQKIICSRLTASGRITLTGDRLIQTSNGERHETLIPNEIQFLHELKNHFDIDLNKSTLNLHRNF